MSRVKFYIITPSYNQAQFIERTIDSILGQQGDFDLVYRVIDGGSNDGTVDILRRYGDRLQWVSEPDRGQVDAINKGLRAAEGDIVAWVNSDDVLKPGALAAVAAAFQRQPEAQWLHGSCEIIDAQDQPIRRWISRYKDYRARRHSAEALLLENYISQMTVFWRRSAHDRVGYLDESLKLAFDYEFWLRLSQLGEPIYLRERIACFRWYETSKSGANYTRQFAEDFEVACRYMPERRRPSLMRRKRMKSHGIVLAYRLLSLLRAVRNE